MNGMMTADGSYWNGYAWVQGGGGNAIGQAIIPAILSKLLEDRDPKVSNVGVKNRLDALGACINDQVDNGWSHVAGATVTVKYPAVFTET